MRRLIALFVPVIFAPTLWAQERSPEADLTSLIQGQALLEDVEEARSLIKREWILSNLTDANFDGALDEIAKNAPKGIKVVELAFRLQRVLALGADGHATVGQFGQALQSVPGPRPDLLIDLAGDRYVALKVEYDPISRVNSLQNYYFAPLIDGYPYLVAVDGVPVAKYVEAAMPFVPQGMPTARRWRAMQLLRDLPVLRREMGMPNPPHILVKLASADGTSEIEVRAPVTGYYRFPFSVPRPAEARIIVDDNDLVGEIGYLWLPDCLGFGTETVDREWPKLQNTKGLIIDLRDNEGGMFETLDVVAARLLPSSRPRVAVGAMICRKGDRGVIGGLLVSAETTGLSTAGGLVVTDFLKAFKPAWQPPKGQETETRTLLLARVDAEPDLRSQRAFTSETPVYDGSVVLLYNHRTFSAAEIMLASLGELEHVTLVGTSTTSGGAGTEHWHPPLPHSRLRLVLAHEVSLRSNGSLIDSRGIAPDVVVEPDADTYTGGRDRMLEKAIEVVTQKIAGRK